MVVSTPAIFLQNMGVYLNHFYICEHRAFHFHFVLSDRTRRGFPIDEQDILVAAIFKLNEIELNYLYYKFESITFYVYQTRKLTVNNKLLHM